MKFPILVVYLLSAILSSAGVYDTLEFGDDRETVTRKLGASKMVEQTIDSTFFGRTGLNGVFKCKTKLAGLTYHLFFDWNETGGLKEITLRSNTIDKAQYNTGLQNAWKEASTLFTQVYQIPAQDAKYPQPADFKGHDILISHIWHKGKKQSVLLGPGIIKEKCFLAIRFVNQHVEPVRIPEGGNGK